MRRLIIAASLMALVGSAEAAQWQQTQTSTDPAAIAQARCSLLAQGQGGGGFYAFGSTGFVVGATIGNVIAQAAAQAAFMGQCMRALGFEPVPRTRDRAARGTGNADLHQGSRSK